MTIKGLRFPANKGRFICVRKAKGGSNSKIKSSFLSSYLFVLSIYIVHKIKCCACVWCMCGVCVCVCVCSAYPYIIIFFEGPNKSNTFLSSGSLPWDPLL